MKYSEQLVAILSSGGVAVIPTDTIYGIVGSALDELVVARMYAIKQRPVSKRFTILVSNSHDITRLGIDSQYVSLFEQVSLEYARPVSINMPVVDPRFSYLAGGMDSFAIRLVQSNRPLKCLLDTVGPLASSSANIADAPTGINIEQAKESFGELVDYYADGGVLPARQSSLVELRIGRPIKVIRS